jgi:hypothetical protein
MRKYCEYYISVRETENGFSWHIWNNWKDGEILQSSNDENGDPDEMYFKSKEVAYQQAAESIQDYYS